MPKYYCEYCGIYLTHSSPSGRKQHSKGRKHISSKVDYYSQYISENNAMKNANPFIRSDTLPLMMSMLNPGSFPGGPLGMPPINVPGIMPSNINLPMPNFGGMMPNAGQLGMAGMAGMAGMSGMAGMAGMPMGQPGMGQPGMGQPGMGQPGMGQPGMGQPGMGHPGMPPGMMLPQMMSGQFGGLPQQNPGQGQAPNMMPPGMMQFNNQGGFKPGQ